MKTILIYSLLYLPALLIVPGIILLSRKVLVLPGKVNSLLGSLFPTMLLVVQLLIIINRDPRSAVFFTGVFSFVIIICVLLKVFVFSKDIEIYNVYGSKVAELVSSILNQNNIEFEENKGKFKINSQPAFIINVDHSYDRASIELDAFSKRSEHTKTILNTILSALKLGITQEYKTKYSRTGLTYISVGAVVLLFWLYLLSRI